MKTFRTILLFTLILISFSNVKAQNEKTVYHFSMATAFIKGEGKKAIITNVQSSKCENYRQSTYSTAIENQLGDYLKAEYSNWHKYNKQAFANFKTLEDAKKQRQKYIGEKKNSGYSITKDIYFSFSCN